MTRTFLVALDIESTLSLDDTATDLEQSLVNDGFEVESVKPWASAAPGALEVPPAIHPMLPTNQTIPPLT